MPHVPGHSPNYIQQPRQPQPSAPMPDFTPTVDAYNLIRQLQELFLKNMNMPGNTPPMTRESQNNLLRDLFQRTMGVLQAQGQAQGQAMSQAGQMMRGVDIPQAQAPVMNPQQFANFAQRSTPPKPGGQQLTTRQMAQQHQLPPGY